MRMNSAASDFRFWILDLRFTKIQNPKSKIQNFRRTECGGQSTTEYAIFIAVVASALVAMTIYVRRGIQAHLKLMERQTSAQPVQE